ncbi:MAG: amidase, partial [Dehalococcoidia bacterium]|nr:amidase [Dehalococcoidia bacterium]
MREPLTYLDAAEMAGLIACGELSPVELVQAHFDRIDELNGDLNAVVVTAADALDRARQAEQAVMDGQPLG